ncbi:PDR/VanB family oxidoreductase [Pseudonocardia sp. WMMC193]|uniref:PDR/VanB family oxidoreductase n=1 Tax=Pseudonocardia sp. WMMC193 TaxID=2911965 RepID=UPI001F45423B|nr:PDR/VanB family oxidoreductase [Pseudonocardia sp. WMMC193]MCF7551556.1 PDR/VanB family oxidoreductase [Pseudonocardia sp. WMMC193]
MSADETAQPSPTFELIVDELRTEADEVVVLALVDESGGELPPWAAGAHIDLHLPIGLIRQYSLCGDPGDRHRYEVAVLRDPESRGGSAWIHDELAKGARISVSFPRNNFELVDAEEYLFVAGGIGVTPFLPMIAAARADHRPYTLVYAGRTRSGMAFVEALADDGAVRLHVSDEGTRADLGALLDGVSEGAAIYGCGPTRLLDALTGLCADRGLSRRLHVEHFSGTVVELDPDREHPFEVELAKTGMVLTVPADRTVLEALLDHGVKTTSSCAEGVCGSCETVVLEGEIDHRDQILDDDERAENEVMMICCSRARSARVVLDL